MRPVRTLYWSSRPEAETLGWKAFRGSIGDQGCFQGDPDPAEVVEVTD